MDLILYSLIIALFALHIVSIALVYRRLKSGHVRPVPLDAQPKITLLRPVCGLEHDLEAALRSGFVQEARDFEVIHCADDADDPALTLLEKLAGENPNVSARIETGREIVSGNPKLDNMLKGWRVATGDWVVMADSNLQLPPDYLGQILSYRAENIGMVSSPAYGDDADGFWARVEAGFLNTYQARWQLVGDEVGNGFAQGKTLAFDREWLNARGGLEALGGEMAEDVASTKLVRTHGLKVAVAKRPFAQHLGRRNFTQIWGRQARWARLRRDGVKGVYLLEPFSTAFLAFAFMAFAAPLWLIPLAVLWYFAEWALARAAKWPHGWRDVAAWIVRDALLPAVWVAGWRNAELNWRNNKVGATQT